MPSTITHTYISLDTLKKLNKYPQSIITRHLEDYKTFAQGMDVLYFYHFYFLKKNYIQELGHTFHLNKTNEILKYIIKEAKTTKNELIFTFLSGLITHYVADSTIHPYVNFLAVNKNNLKHQDMHFEIETFLDNYMLEKNNKNYHNYPNYKLQFNNKKEISIVQLLDNIYIKYFNYPKMGDKYYHALKSMKFVFHYIRYDKLGIKRNIYKFIDVNKLPIRRITNLSYNFNLKNKDFYLNNTHKLWHNVNDQRITSTKSFDELYLDVINKSSTIINKLYDYIYSNKKIDLDLLLENKSYSTGLILK